MHEKGKDMTLDETIKRFTSNAEYERTHGNLQGYLEFKQLAEWLEALKLVKYRDKKGSSCGVDMRKEQIK